jgi:hypothetical protein
MDSRLERDVRFLKGYAVVTSLIIGILSLAAFTQTGQRTRFEEIDVERINVIEKDGKLRLVISNRDRSPGPISRGKPFGYPGGTRPGMIFFNDEGSENGGLTFTGKREPDGTFRASSHFAFDQFDQDQVLYLNYNDNNGQRRLGLTIADRANVPIYDWVLKRDSINKLPDGPAKTEALRKLTEPPPPGEPLFAPRVYVGRDVNKNALLTLADRLGKTRLRLVVDSLGSARLEFLDADGRVTQSLPDSTTRGRR